ncbi:MAG: hypothetical protein L0227_18750, partial [Chloroflexi bacterium]|nr:hypothetical protein [Chloroflexota bacterium]
MTDVDADLDGALDPDPSAETATPEARGRSLRNAATLTAAVGIAFAVLFGLSFVLTLGTPGGK